MNLFSFEYQLFVIFLFIICFYFAKKKSKRIIVLIIASYVFYFLWNEFFLFFLVLSTIINYYFAKLIFKSESGTTKKKYFISLLIINIGTLLFFKYTNFIIENINILLTVLELKKLTLQKINISSPIGISFYTFQVITYSFDIYWGFLKPCGSFFKFSLFPVFFRKF